MSQTFDPATFADTVLSGTPIAAGRRPSSRLVTQLMQRIEEVTDEVVLTIRRRVDSYADGQAVPRDDLWWSVRANLDMLMRVIAEDRELTPEEVHARAALGRRRAQQSLAVTSLIQAFQIGYIEVWRQLSEAATAAGEEAVTDLLEIAGRFWAMMHQVSSAVAEAHHEVSREEVSLVRRRALTFLDLLSQLPGTMEQATEEALDLGLDPTGLLVAAVRTPSKSDDPLRYREWGVLLIERQRSVVLLANATGDGEPFAQERARIGVGLPRQGLEGARDSCKDATLAYEAARVLRRRRVCYATDWFECLAVSQYNRLQPLVAEAVRVLHDDELVRQTLSAFLDANGRLAQAAEAIHVHANTIGYRLDRFTERTGVDPRSSDGVLRARLALLLSERNSTPE